MTDIFYFVEICRDNIHTVKPICVNCYDELIQSWPGICNKLGVGPRCGHVLWVTFLPATKQFSSLTESESTRTGQHHRGIRQSQLGTCKHIFSFCEHTSKDQYFDLCHFLHLYLFFHLFLFFSCKNKNINHFMNMLSLCQHRKYAAYQHWTLGSGTHTQTHSPVRNGNTESHIIHICTHMHHQDYNLHHLQLKWYEEKKPALMQNQVISKKYEK